MKTLYSRKAILGFSAFCTPIFGAFLMRYNLKEINQSKKGNQAVLLSVFLTAIIIYLNLTFDNGLAILFNFFAGLLLAELFYKKQLEDTLAFEIKPIKQPALVALAIFVSIIFILSVFYNFK
ncbi:hypothetical protein K5I29_10160 [Flavobacterium agricola]|uniref:Uncharacterized protein n=1 Tax=Flavobacterium agricola TaxID=2870839 RepID=A0ABY6LX06_9FLAO|nr:hypothetical protein [Flavobacterium agricola]UYW00862.1 hypothetical protein K5I29_10160 [Flavobacterium agricola]